jgi:predicted nucleic acid-binding protein
VSVASIPSLPAGKDVLLDANVLIYGLRGQSPQCLALLTRCATEEVIGITTIDIITDVCHKLMLAEAFAGGAITKEAASQLRARPAVVSRLTEYWAETLRLLNLNLLVLGLEEARLHGSQAMRSAHGLLTKDSLIVAAAQEFGIDSLASADTDFARVSWLTLYQPTDI